MLTADNAPGLIDGSVVVSWNLVLDFRGNIGRNE